jgi:hypothetical protein
MLFIERLPLPTIQQRKESSEDKFHKKNYKNHYRENHQFYINQGLLKDWKLKAGISRKMCFLEISSVMFPVLTS